MEEIIKTEFKEVLNIIKDNKILVENDADEVRNRLQSIGNFQDIRDTGFCEFDFEYKSLTLTVSRTENGIWELSTFVHYWDKDGEAWDFDVKEL